MKNIFILVIFTLLSFNTQAQNFEAKLIGGFTASQIDGDAQAGYNKVGLVAGAATNFYLSERVSLQEELVFYMRGARGSNNDFNFGAVRMNYLDINMLLNIYLSEKVFVQAGPSFGVLMAASQNGWDMDSPVSNTLSATAGVSYMLNQNLEVSLRTMYSITRIHKLNPWLHNSLAFSLRFYL